MNAREQRLHDAQFDHDACPCGSSCPDCRPDLFKAVYMGGRWHTLPIDACELTGEPLAECTEPGCTHLTDEMQPMRRSA